jgi:hypothetical protein
VTASRRTPRRAAALLGVLLAAGCAADDVATACPAIGWPVTLSVADPTGAAAVELCVDGGCASSADPAEGRDPASPVFEVDRSATGWDFVLAGADDEVTVRRLDADGSVLAERTVRPWWERTGGTEECGGPQRAVVPL